MKRTIIIILSALVAFSTSAVAAEASVSSVSAQQPKKAKAELKDVTFKVNLHCPSCKKKLEENISFEKGVKGLSICMEDQIVSIKYDPSKTNEDILRAAIQKLGVPVKAKLETARTHTHTHK